MENSQTFKMTINPSHSIISKSQTSSLADNHQHKKRYQAVIQQQMENERQKIKQKVQKKRKTQQKIYKNHLKSQINKKKKQLQFLDNQTNNQSQLISKASHLAQIKMKNDKLKKEEERIKAEKANSMSKIRYKSAVNYHEQVRQQTNQKKTQAQYLRNIHQKSEEQQRSKAVLNNKISVSRYLEQQKQNQKNKKYQMNFYQKQIHKHGLAKTKHDIRSASNLVNFIVQQNQEENTAFAKGQIQNMRKIQLQKLKIQSQQRNRKIAVNRVNNVVQQKKRLQQYQRYCEQTQKQQIKYNLRRIQAGKTNQFVGVKPMTMSQINFNKKNRAEKSFQASFLKNLKQISQDPARKYEIIQNKMKDNPKKQVKLKKYTKKPINYLDNESLIPQNSQGHYSFESGRKSMKSQQRNARKRDNNLRQIQFMDQQMKNTILPQKENDFTKTRMKQTRVSNNHTNNAKHHERQDLDYSQSSQSDDAM